MINVDFVSECDFLFVDLDVWIIDRACVGLGWRETVGWLVGVLRWVIAWMDYGGLGC